jgi:protein O-mannosyl-transferase
MTNMEPTDGASGERTAVSAPTPYDSLADKTWLLALVLVAVTFVAYSPLLRGTFVWDDDAWTTKIPQLLRDVTGLRSIWCHPTALQQYYPLTATTFWLDYHLWGFWTLPYHVENVLLHILAALLFWRLLWRLQVPGAWFAGAIFALHPVMVESAGWITERKNVLSLVLYFGALLLYGRRISFWRGYTGSTPRVHSSPTHYCCYLAAWLLFLGALLAKATAFSLPAVILLIGWWRRGRIRWQQDVVPTLPFFALAIGLGMVTAALEKNHVGATGPEWAIPFPERCLIAGRALAFYIGKLLWPVNLCFVYPRWHPDANSLSQWLYPVTAVGLVWGLWVARDRIGRGPATAAFFFIGTLFPVLGFMNAYFMRYSFVCDHWVYLSSLGPIALAAAGMVTAFRLFRRKRTLLGPAICGTLLLLLAAGTWQQAHIYRDIQTLWRDTLAKNPRCWMAYNNLGVILVRQGRVQEAMEHYQQALRFNPNFAEAHYDLGDALIRMHKPQDAVAHFERALQMRPDWVAAQNNLAWLLATLPPAQGGSPARAVSLAQQACERTGYRVEGDLDTLGVAYASAGRFDEAAATAQKAIELARSTGQSKLADEIEARLQLYRSGRPYREPLANKP